MRFVLTLMPATAAALLCCGCGGGATEETTASSDPEQNVATSKEIVADADQEPAFDATGAVAFRSVRVFDGERVIDSATVLVADGRIVESGPEVAVPEGVETIEGAGKTLLPGFIDSHTHTFFPDQLRQAAVFGVTTELDMAGDPGFAGNMRQQQQAGEADARADLLAAGIPVTARGGHPTQLPAFGGIPTIESPDQAAEFVAARIAEGSDYIKLIYDNGTAYGLEFPTISPETMQAVVEAAHGLDALAVAHIATRDGAREAVDAGVDGLVHLFVDEAIDEELLQLALERNVFVVPTLTILQSAGGEADGATLVEDPDLGPLLRPDNRRNLQSTFPRGAESRVDYAVATEAARKLAEAGVRVLVGTDAPNPGTTHGASMHRELELLVNAGLTPEQALAGATSLPADAFGLTDRGRIAPDLRADLVLVDGDPTTDITTTRRIVGVWKAGQAIDREAYREQVEAAVAAQSATAPPSEGGLVSDFEGDEVTSSFGSGWAVSTDALVGGGSTAEFRLAEGGAEKSEGSLLVTGTIEDRPQPRWAGVTFSPGSAVMAPADLSAREAVSFHARGDGGEYYVMLFFQARGFAPSTKTFTAGPDWEPHRFELKDFDGCDGTGIMGLFFGGGEETGEFEFRVDEVRFE